MVPAIHFSPPVALFFALLHFYSILVEYHGKTGFNFWLKDTSVVQMRCCTEALDRII